MLIRRGLIFLVVLFSLVSCHSPAAKQQERTYKIGFMICNSKQETLSRFRPLCAYLSQKLGVNFEPVPIDTTDFTRQVDKLDFTHTNSLLYIIMHRNDGVNVLCAEKAGPLGSRSQGAIVTLKSSGIKTLKDLKGKSMVFGPMLGPTAYMSELDLLLKAGIDPDRDLSFYTIPPGSFKHEKVFYSVLFGKYDAGAFPMLDFDRMVDEGKLDRDDFHVIALGTPIPYCTFGVTQRVDDAFAKKVKDALTSITKDDTVALDGEIVKVLDRANIDGYEDIKDKDYDVVRDMAKRTNMPPYQKF
ncbi:MAG: phosphate/phosphite/phosphonate ABC transporter substrate-binding protein [Nitrospiraceae bacterium]|nr:phosphate/phosphite/phosphonate ABC transporter substrate-binding protein [Nitrospiraceae bacterium]